MVLRVCLDDRETLLLLTKAAEGCARATVPGEVFRAFVSTTMTALDNGGGPRHRQWHSVPTTGCPDSRRQFGNELEAVWKQYVPPFQIALPTLTQTQMSLCLSVDGRDAYDHVHRASMMSKLFAVSGSGALLPFVRASYVSLSLCSWEDDQGQRHEIRQHEGAEQGGPLVPLLFSLAIHNALAEVKAKLVEGELLFAFLDDVYVVAQPAKISFISWDPIVRGSRDPAARLERGIV